MAMMRPELTEVQLSQFQSRAEAILYRACRDQLDDRCLVLHSVNWIRTTGDKPQDGEADFVVFDPDDGITVIETKGGGIGFDPSKGEWYSIDRHDARHKIKDPFQQAKSEKYAILDQLNADRSWRRRRVHIGHAVFFPNVSDVSRLVSPQSPLQIMGGRNDLPDFSRWLSQVQAYWAGQDSQTRPLGHDGLTVAMNLFCRPVEVRPLVSALLEDEDAVRLRLTQQQARQLRMLGTRTRAAISGGAGTGKTLLSVEKARELAGIGKRVLLVCYNRPLADHLKVVIGNNPQLLPMTFHQLCDWLIRKAKVERARDVLEEAQRSFPSEDSWTVQMPFALALAAELGLDTFDAILVDEGQDFHPNFWFAIESLLNHTSESFLYVFYDPNQAVYRPLENMPIDEAPFPLTVNCRNTRHIHEAAYTYYQGDFTEPPEIDGTPIEMLTAVELSEQARQIHATISHLISIEKVVPSDIAVLVAGKSKQRFYDLLRQYTLPGGSKWSIEQHRIGNTVLVDTVHRFKGLETAIEFLWGFDQLDAATDRETLYVGVSRAKSRLYLCGTELACSVLFKAAANTSTFSASSTSHTLNSQ